MSLSPQVFASATFPLMATKINKYGVRVTSKGGIMSIQF
jgi:hypothetical protein